MKRSVLEKIASLREKVVNIQIKLVQVEKTSSYVDEQHFEWYKPDIEKVLEELDVCIMGVETAVERTLALAEDGWDFGDKDCDYYVSKELKEGSQRVSKKIQNINDLFDKALN